MKKSMNDQAVELTNQINELNEKEKILSRKLVEYNSYFEVKEKMVSKYTNPEVALESLKELKQYVKQLEESLDSIYDTKAKLNKQLKNKTFKYYISYVIDNFKNKNKHLTKRK